MVGIRSTFSNGIGYYGSGGTPTPTPSPTPTPTPTPPTVLPYSWENDFTAASIPAGMTFTRASTGYYVNSGGVLASAAIDTPRYTHAWDGATYAPAGLMLESAATNLTLQSQTFDSATWNKTNATVTANAAVAPDGTTTADKLTPNTSNATHPVYQAWSTTAIYGCFQAYAKAAGYNFLQFSGGDAGTNRFSFIVDLTSGAVSDCTNISPSAIRVQQLASGWYEVSAYFVMGLTGNAYMSLVGCPVAGLVPDSFQNITFTGDGTSGIYCWGAQFTHTRSPTSYVATVAASATRSADSLVGVPATVITGFDASKGTMVFDVSAVPAGPSSIGTLLSLDDGTTNNRMTIYRSGSGIFFSVLTGGVSQAVVSLGWSEAFRVAVSWEANSFRIAVNGQMVSDTSGTVPTINNLRIGTYVSANNEFRGLVNWVGYTASTVSDADLAGATRFLIPGSYLGAVADRTIIPTGFSSANKQLNARRYHYARDTITSLRLVYPNFGVASITGSGFAVINGTETGPGATATITASVEATAGVYTQVTFPSDAPDNGYIVSDPVSVSIAQDAKFYTNVAYRCTGGVLYKFNNGVSNAMDEAGGDRLEMAVSGLPDRTMTGGYPANASNTIAYGPIAIIATTAKGSVILIGDSRVAGLYDQAADQQGELERALGPVMGVINCGASSDRAVWAAASFTNRLALAQYATHAFIELGTNDAANGAATGPQIVAARNTLRTALETAGLLVCDTTFAPRSTSTDSWATTANQTTGAGETARVAANTCWRETPSVFDVTAGVESGLNSGKWAVDGTPFKYTGDGTHETPFGYAAAAATVNPKYLVYPA